MLRELITFGRDGKPRFPPLTLEGSFTNAPMLDRSGAKPRIICVSREGVLYACDLDLALWRGLFHWFRAFVIAATPGNGNEVWHTAKCR